MKLDSEEQRQKLLAMLANTHIEGTLEGISQALPGMQQLYSIVQSAPLETQNEPSDN